MQFVLLDKGFTLTRSVSLFLKFDELCLLDVSVCFWRVKGSLVGMVAALFVKHCL